jgi:TPR repeat protein
MDLQSRYETGNGVKADPVMAKSYYLKAMRIWCDKGDNSACAEL